jgi:hypothetical protein
MKASQHTACYRSRTTPCASDPKTTQPDGPLVPDAVIPPHKQATSHTQRDHSNAMHVQTRARHTTTTTTATAATTTTTQQLHTASECRKGRTCRIATTFDSQDVE